MGSPQTPAHGAVGASSLRKQASKASAQAHQPTTSPVCIGVGQPHGLDAQHPRPAQPALTVDRAGVRVAVQLLHNTPGVQRPGWIHAIAKHCRKGVRFPARNFRLPMPAVGR